MPQPDSCRGCPLYGVGRGFAVGTGDPKTAKLALVLEALGKDEVDFALRPVKGRWFFETAAQCDREMAIRTRDYPDVPVETLRVGAPTVGQTGAALDQWLLPAIGLTRHELFIDNTLRCLPPKNKEGTNYPTGDDRKLAEKHCRQYDRFHLFRPQALVVTMHPAALLREMTPFPLVVEDFKRARDFVGHGLRTALLLGGKSAAAFMRHSESVLKCRGNYKLLPPDWAERYKAAFEFTAKAKKETTGGEKRKRGKRAKQESDLQPPDFA